MVAIVLLHLVGLVEHVVHPVALVFHGLHLAGVLHAHRNGIECGPSWFPSGRVIACTREIPGTAEDALGQFVQDQEVRRVAHVVVGFDHQDLWLHSGLGKMAIRGREALISGDEFGEVARSL